MTFLSSIAKASLHFLPWLFSSANVRVEEILDLAGLASHGQEAAILIRYRVNGRVRVYRYIIPKWVVEREGRAGAVEEVSKFYDEQQEISALYASSLPSLSRIETPWPDPQRWITVSFGVISGVVSLLCAFSLLGINYLEWVFELIA
jgi:hypothetical protein